MKTSIYLFTYVFEGHDHKDFVVASDEARATYVFTAHYPNVIGWQVSYFAEALS